ncbi:MAG TPA: hypothetical protein VJ371_21070, partial [Streptosporangiaceae bacterium]|nr:hypothetical protein [Streptosporangiaceae bacterium]
MSKTSNTSCSYCEQNAQKYGKCGLLAQLAQVLPTAFPRFTLAAPSRFYVMEIYPAKEMMTVASAFAKRLRAARGARERTGTAEAAPIEL